MISNILIGAGLILGGFIIGSVTGAVGFCNMVIKVNKIYESETGNSFVKWVFDKSAKINKNRIDKVYAAE